MADGIEEGSSGVSGKSGENARNFRIRLRYLKATSLKRLLSLYFFTFCLQLTKAAPRKCPNSVPKTSQDHRFDGFPCISN
jgi:hypothetical protein